MTFLLVTSAYQPLAKLGTVDKMQNTINRLVRNLLEFFSALKWCIVLSWNTSKFYTASRIIAEILTPAFSIISAFIGKNVINILAGQMEYYNRNNALLLLLGLLLTIAVVRGLAQKMVQYFRAMHDDMMDASISSSIIENALNADLEYFDMPAYYDKLKSSSRDSYAINQIVWNSTSVVSSLISFIVTYTMLSQMRVLYGVLIVLSAIPYSAVAAKFTKILYGLSLEQTNGQRRMGYIQTIATERLYAQDFRLFDACSKLKSRYVRIWKELFTPRRIAARKRTVLLSLLECLPELCIALIGIDIAFSVISGSMTVGDYSLFVGLTAQLLGIITMLSVSIMQIYDNRMKLDNFRTVQNICNRIEDKGTNKLNVIQSIELRNVSFAYPEAKEKTLYGISCSMNRGERIAIVGLNGSGKSTLIKLLLRFYDPDEGEIHINGLNIKEYTLASLRKNFSVYFQETRSLSFSIRENFSVADDYCNDDDMENAALSALSSASCLDIIEKCKEGLDSNITKLFSDDGVELSFGQQQKLALARALFRRHTALILDEPSSSMDPKSEHDVFEALKSLTEGKLTIFTSHRLSNVLLADRIIVLENGRIVEDGTQNELLCNQKRYAELFKYQQKMYLTS